MLLYLAGSDFLLNYYYFEGFCLVKIGSFPCIGKKIYLVLHVLVVYLIDVVVFVCIAQLYVCIYGNNYTIFRMRFSFKVWVFCYIFEI